MVKEISIEIDKFLINREYIDFFMQMYLQKEKDDGSTSFFPTSIIPRVSHFEKLDFSLFRVYIETETTNHCFVCCNFQTNILV